MRRVGGVSSLVLDAAIPSVLPDSPPCDAADHSSPDSPPCDGPWVTPVIDRNYLDFPPAAAIYSSPMPAPPPQAGAGHFLLST